MRQCRNHRRDGAELRLHVYGGGIIVDGTCTWIVDDVRDGTPVGQVRASMFVPAGYVKLEGATVNRSNYPRLVALANKYSLWTADPTNNPGLFGEGDGSTTMVLPNWAGRMAQFAATAGGAVAAGLPNVYGAVYSIGYAASYSEGAFSVRNQVADRSFPTGGNQAGSNLIIFDAKEYNSIYGSSTTVQPPAINVFAIMRY